MYPTMQEQFNTVVTHARVQRSVSRGENGLCAYRGKNGVACFLGALISDKEYRLAFDGDGLYTEKVIDAVSTLNPQYTDFYIDMQDIHDDVPVDKWEEALAEVAEQYELTLSRF